MPNTGAQRSVLQPPLHVALRQKIGADPKVGRMYLYVHCTTYN